ADASGLSSRGGDKDRASSMRIRSFGRTDVGRHRRANEDAFFRDDELRLYVVADGMGGHAAGEVASAEAVETIYGMVKRGLRATGVRTRRGASGTRSAAWRASGTGGGATRRARSRAPRRSRRSTAW